MNEAATTMTLPEVPSRKFTPVSQPILLLPTSAARLYTHLHPVLLLALYNFAFPTLVAAPIAALLSALLPLSCFQASYVILCLPASGSSIVSSALSKPPKPGQRKRPVTAKPNTGLSTKFAPTFLSLALTFLLATPFLTVLLILFGAPLTTHFPHNILCATHMALLAVFPLVYVHGVDSKMWREIASVSLPFDEVWGGTIGTVVGAWLGAVPIPLDWDREWQKWPVTIVTGAYLGYVVGKLGGKYLLQGKRIEFD